MNAGVISTRYAKAIYDYAQENGKEEYLYKRLKTLKDNFSRFPLLSEVLKDPTVLSSEKINVLLTACGEPVEDILKNVIHLIVNNERTAYMKSIVWVYDDYYRKAKGIVIANLITVEPASEKIKQDLTRIIAQIENEEVEFRSETDPEILGGFILEIGDKRLNASVKNQLSRLRLDLTN